MYRNRKACCSSLREINMLALFPRAMSQVPCLHEHLTNAARVKYPVACSGVFDFMVFSIDILDIRDYNEDALTR